MDLTKVYKDSEGLELSIYQMVRREPDWAANRLQEGELAIEELATLKAESAEKSDNTTKTEICGETLESECICNYCIHWYGCTMSSFCALNNYQYFIGRKLSAIC